MKRYLEKYMSEDLSRKIVFVTGPRQSGKTTLSKMLLENHDYLNFDNPEHRINLIDRSWDRSKKLIIFDELHKWKNWKSWLKGIYDTEGIPPAILVTGSAKLDTSRKVGDSMAGRYFQFRLHPLDLKEVINNNIRSGAHGPSSDTPEAALEQLLEIGGFPEPFLAANSRFYKRWKKTHLDIIIKQDLLDLENVRNISIIETLVQLLRRQVGSPVSYNSLARDLQVSDKTIKRWLTILENMYVIFRVPPYHRNIARSILKAPKFYFYDTGQVIGDSGSKLENLTACALLKEMHFREDCFGDTFGLHYVKTKEGKEIDFLVTKDDTPYLLAEVKWAASKLSPNFKLFEKHFTSARKVQIVKEISKEKTFPCGTEIRAASQWLASLSLASESVNAEET